MTAGIGAIVGALILASTANDPPGSIVIQGESVAPRLYRSATVGDGLTPETAFRPAIMDDLAGKPHQIKWDDVSGQAIVWAEDSEHISLAAKHEFLGTPEAGP